MSFTELEDHLLAVTWAVALMHEKHRRFCMAKDIDEDIDRELHILEQLRGRLRADYTARFCVLYGPVLRNPVYLWSPSSCSEASLTTPLLAGALRSSEYATAVDSSEAAAAPVPSRAAAPGAAAARDPRRPNTAPLSTGPSDAGLYELETELKAAAKLAREAQLPGAPSARDIFRWCKRLRAMHRDSISEKLGTDVHLADGEHRVRVQEAIRARDAGFCLTLLQALLAS